mmetsp:Transcript_3310/g.9506  ORF Transcript_3310/g.9506 Transcript_3310/m.9506 type:complete len:289 (+) Transcript_3310:878-1744(+)
MVQKPEAAAAAAGRGEESPGVSLHPAHLIRRTVAHNVDLVGVDAALQEALPDKGGWHPHLVCRPVERCNPLRWDRLKLPRQVHCQAASWSGLKVRRPVKPHGDVRRSSEVEVGGDDAAVDGGLCLLLVSGGRGHKAVHDLHAGRGGVVLQEPLHKGPGYRGKTREVCEGGIPSDCDRRRLGCGGKGNKTSRSLTGLRWRQSSRVGEDGPKLCPALSSGSEVLHRELDHGSCGEAVCHTVGHCGGAGVKVDLETCCELDVVGGLHGGRSTGLREPEGWGQPDGCMGEDQ